MLVREIMTPDAITVSPDDSILNVSEIIFKNRFHAVPVMKNNKLVGIITEDDFFLKNYDDLFLPAYIKFLKDHRASNSLSGEMKEKVEKLLLAKASDIMTHDCVTVSPETETSELMDVIKKTKFTTFPVVDEGDTLLGIVTLADILGTVRQGSRQMEKMIGEGDKSGEVRRIAQEIHSAWNDQMLLISKKRVRTWQGGILIVLLTVAAAISFLAMNAGNRTACEIEQNDFVANECQRFTYSDWSPCQVNGTQTRTVLEKLPRNCEGGQMEKLVRSCQ
jgi:CBS domain-containing protein